MKCKNVYDGRIYAVPAVPPFDPPSRLAKDKQAASKSTLR